MAGAWFRLPSGQLYHVAGRRPVAPARSVPVATEVAVAELAGAHLVGMVPVVVTPEQAVDVVDGVAPVRPDVPVGDLASKLDEGGAGESGDPATLDDGGA